MRKFNALFSLTVVILLAACSWSPNFMGAEKWIGGNIYIERWFLNPDKPTRIPEGTAFYGAAANKIKNRFIIKYYIAEANGDSTTEIPANDMWKVKHNGKYYTEQDDDNLFFYVRDGNNFKKYHVAGADCCLTIDEDDKLLPIKECYKNGWCELYPTEFRKTLYVKRSILYQGPTILNEKQKAKLARDAIHVTPATPPWITPTAQACENNGGEMNSRGVCQAKWKAANRICADMGGRLPTIGELKQVVIECGGTVDIIHGNKNVHGYEACYRQKGFSYEYEGYFSSTVKIPKGNVYPSEVYVMYVSQSDSSTNTSFMNFSGSILCQEN